MDDDILRALERWDAELHHCLEAAAASGADWEADLDVLRDLAGLGQRLVALVVAQRDRLEGRLGDRGV